MTVDDKSKEITQPIHVTSAPMNNHATAGDKPESSAKKWTIPEWLIEFVQETETQSTENAHAELIKEDPETEVSLPVSPEDAEWQPVQAEQETDFTVSTVQQEFNFNELDLILSSKDYAQICDNIKVENLNTEEKASLIIKLRSHLLLDEKSACLWELYEKIK